VRILAWDGFKIHMAAEGNAGRGRPALRVCSVSAPGKTTAAWISVKSPSRSLRQIAWRRTEEL